MHKKRLVMFQCFYTVKEKFEEFLKRICFSVIYSLKLIEHILS